MIGGRQSRQPDDIDFAAYLLDVVKSFRGEPNQNGRAANDVRWGRKGSLSIDPQRGVWHDHESGEGGGTVDFVRRELQCTARQAADWLKQKGFAGTVPTVRTKPKLVTADPEAIRKQRLAWAMYENKFSCLDNTPCEAYLRRRGIWEAARETPMRWSRITHYETGEADVHALIVPRMDEDTGEIRGIQRIYLTPDGHKYADGTAKLSLGSGFRGRAELFTPEADLVLAEGPESAIAAAILTGWAAWALCGSFPERLRLPGRVRRVLVFADNDERGTPQYLKRLLAEGMPAKEARAKAVGSQQRGQRLVNWIRATGRNAELIVPQNVGEDANDMLLAGGFSQWKPATGGCKIEDTLDVPGAEMPGHAAYVDVTGYPFASECDDSPFITQPKEI